MGENNLTQNTLPCSQELTTGPFRELVKSRSLSHPVSLRFISLLFSHLCLGLASDIVLPFNQYSVWLRTGRPVRFPAEAKNFSSSHCVQTGSEAHTASYPMGTRGPFAGAKHDRGVTLTTRLSNAEVKNEYELYFLSPLAPAWLTGTTLLLR
jgi:hypothetical protein